MTLEGAPDAVLQGERVLEELADLTSEGYTLKPDDITYALRATRNNQGAPLRSLLPGSSSVLLKNRVVAPKSPTQKAYVEAIQKHDIVIAIGPAGTGKTYLAMAMAVGALTRKEVSRIVLARPAVEAGEKLGFLPGDMYAKVNPYLRPLYDALYSMMEVERANRLVERGEVEIAPLAFMRGRTLNDSFVILDEAQNATAEQMKMFLTRLGFNSKVVVTGDITQVDLPPDRTSGLVQIQAILHDISGIQFIHFDERDVVRHRLVQDIIKAYEHYDDTQASKGEAEAKGHRGEGGQRPRIRSPKPPEEDGGGQPH